MTEVELLDAVLRSGAARSETAAIRQGFGPVIVEQVSASLDMKLIALVQAATHEPKDLAAAYRVELETEMERAVRGPPRSARRVVADNHYKHRIV